MPPKGIGGTGSGILRGESFPKVVIVPFYILIVEPSSVFRMIRANTSSSFQIVDKTIMEADLDRDGKISFEEFTKMVENTDVSMSMTLGTFTPSFFETWAPYLMYVPGLI